MRLERGEDLDVGVLVDEVEELLEAPEAALANARQAGHHLRSNRDFQLP